MNKMTKMTKHQEGFTLVELMIGVAIIGILGSLAVSSYQTYTIRAQVAEAISMGAGAKSPVVDAFNMNGEPPANRVAAGMTATPGDSGGSYVSAVDIFEGTVTVTMGNRVHADVFGKTVSFTPYSTPSGGIVWRCGSEPAPGSGAVRLEGGGVQSAYRAPTVEARYLPSTCRI